MLTIAAALAARAWVSTWPSRGSSAPGSSAASSDDLGRDAQGRLASQVGDALLLLDRAALGAGLGSAGAEVQARDEVQEVLPRALAVALAKRRQLVPEDVVVAQLLDEFDQLGLELVGDAGDDVDETVGVRADEVQGSLGEPRSGKLGADRRPPAPGQPRVAGVRAAEHPQPQRQPPLGDQPHPFAERLAPCIAQAGPVLDAASELARALLGRDVRGARRVRPARAAHANADLVPLDLERDERGHEVVDVRGAGQQHCERAGAAVVPAAPAGGGFGLLPGLDRDAAGGQRLDILAHDHELGARDPVGQPLDRVQKRAEVELLAGGEWVQTRAQCAVGRLEHPQLRFAARAQ